MQTPATTLMNALDMPAPKDGRTFSEEEFIQRLADAVDYWMQYRMEELMSLCYTLDVNEAGVARAFHPSAPEPANLGLARLLYARQLRRLATQQTIKSPPVDDADAW
ncbi:hypothetical protein [Neolewinella antarctica]|uniref:Uncharacterized protein n=1 Tax=Neolewinella antarctica TaxID=442734 RepID=A0ABX0X9B6_9BACT|nr:hypothetical protein [Neolewinella antarctica]NJC25861.1 hypothetical protein [Neolewinella antarctica]